MRIVTVPGTGLDTIKVIVKTIDPNAELAVISSPAEVDGRFRYDRVLLLGGADIDPKYYGEAPRHSGRPQPTRDLVEWTLAKKALAKGIPIMGICRGHQMIAAAAGGRLYQDVLWDGATQADHACCWHNLEKVRRPLSKYLAEDPVNSYHHQAVRRVPAGFEVMAWSDDGLVEAMWRPGALGVQFHPELMFPRQPRWIGLFRWLIEGGLRSEDRPRPSPSPEPAARRGDGLGEVIRSKLPRRTRQPASPEDEAQQLGLPGWYKAWPSDD